MRIVPLHEGLRGMLLVPFNAWGVGDGTRLQFPQLGSFECMGVGISAD